MSVPVIEPNSSGRSSGPGDCDRSDIARLIDERLIGLSQWACRARGIVAAHAAHDAALIIEGEPGAGKEFLARLIHQCSVRCRAPFVTFACDSVSEASAEAALFGSIRTLPSGGNRIQRGLVEVAQGGTLYISGLMAASTLIKTELARLIHHQEFRRLGDSLLEEANVRVIIGVNSHSPKPGGTWSVNTSSLALADVISIPPLRQRRADIEPLSRYFIDEACRMLRRERRELSDEALDALQRYTWPGNVGELKRVLKSMVERSMPPQLTPELLPAHLKTSAGFGEPFLSSTGIDLGQELGRLEKALLCAALKHCHGHQSKAARLLGLKRTTLNTKLKRYGIDVNMFK